MAEKREWTLYPGLGLRNMTVNGPHIGKPTPVVNADYCSQVEAERDAAEERAEAMLHIQAGAIRDAEKAEAERNTYREALERIANKEAVTVRVGEYSRWLSPAEIARSTLTREGSE